jgi:hypothetical protein
MGSLVVYIYGTEPDIIPDSMSLSLLASGQPLAHLILFWLFLRPMFPVDQEFEQPAGQGGLLTLPTVGALSAQLCPAGSSWGGGVGCCIAPHAASSSSSQTAYCLPGGAHQPQP